MKSGLYTKRFNAMGSPCEIQFYSDSKLQAQKKIIRLINTIRNLENRYSRYKADSILSVINQHAATGGKLKVDKETESLLNYAHTCYLESDGLFDISSGALRKVWKFQEGRIPSPQTIQDSLYSIGWDKISWEPPFIEFTHLGMELDFGGIVKEYAADRCAHLAQEFGIQNGAINLGGDIRIMGPHLDGSPWRIGIKSPFQANHKTYSASLTRGGIASSGDYERCMVVDGIKYSHILNPKTGYPSSRLSSVSVIADLCTIAGTASTVAMLKEEQAESWLNELGLPYLIIDNDNQVFKSHDWPG